MMQTNWLITGGCGFIGVNLVRALQARGDYIRIMDNLSGGSREDLSAVADFADFSEANAPEPGRVELLEGDVRYLEECQKATQNMDVVVHLAAQTGVIPSLEDPYFDCEQNVTGILNMLVAAREAGIKRFIFASSAAPLGEQDPPVDEQKVPRPLAPYGASKLAGEAYCSAFHGSFGMDTVALRFSNVYGPYSFKKGSVVAEFFRRALAGKPLVIYGDGEQTRDFIHAEDLCGAITKAAEKDVGGELFQIATGRETSVNELAGRVKDLVEGETKTPVEVTHAPPRQGEIRRNYADISKSVRLLDHHCKIDFQKGLLKTLEWFKLYNVTTTKNRLGLFNR